MDGTALDAQSLIGPKTEQALRKAINNGHYVSIATGRLYRVSHQFCQQPDLTAPMVSFDGTLVHISERKWDLRNEANIERDLIFNILTQKKELQLGLVTAESKEAFYINTLDELGPKFFVSRVTLDNSLTTRSLRINPTSMMIQTIPNQAGKVADTLTKQYGDYIDIRIWGGPMPILEMVAKRTQKTHGIDQAADFLSTKPADITAFGDEYNDGEVSSYTDWGVAMNNVMDKIKSVVSDVAGEANDQDGLADCLESYLDLQKTKTRVLL